MNSEIWGPHTWYFLHTISFNYPNNPSSQIRERFYDFFNSLSYVLPCEVCRNNYSKKLQNLNLLEHLNSRQLLIEFVIKLHNSVSLDLNKREYTYDEVMLLYNNMYNSNKLNNLDSNYILYLIISIFICILLRINFFVLHNKHIIKIIQLTILLYKNVVYI